MSFNKVFYYSAEYLLSETTKKACIERFTKMSGFRISARKPDSKKTAAVLVPLCEVKNKMSLMYTLRSSNLKRHAGLVSFPGGLADHNDKDVIDTALRETQEETGLCPDDIDVWGSSQSYIQTLSNDIAIYPVFGFIKNYDELTLKPSLGEVDVIFTLPLEDLCNPTNIKLQIIERGDTASFTIPQYFGGPKEIWGITALITDAYLRSLLPCDVYSSEKPSYIKNR